MNPADLDRGSTSTVALTTVVLGREAVPSSGPSITIGRSSQADVKLDLDRPDPSLSLITGSVTNRAGAWHLINHAARTSLVVRLDDGAAVTLEPNSPPLPLGCPTTADIQLDTMRSYRFGLFVRGVVLPSRLPTADGAGYQRVTGSVADLVELTGRERWLLATLAQSRLTTPETDRWSVPAPDEIRSRIGLRDIQVELLLDAIGAKLAPYLGPLLGPDNRPSMTRRHQIVDFAVRSHCVTAADLVGPAATLTAKAGLP